MPGVPYFPKIRKGDEMSPWFQPWVEKRRGQTRRSFNFGGRLPVVGSAQLPLNTKKNKTPPPPG